MLNEFKKKSLPGNVDKLVDINLRASFCMATASAILAASHFIHQYLSVAP